jgi:hypothetical protein
MRDQPQFTSLMAKLHGQITSTKGKPDSNMGAFFEGELPALLGSLKPATPSFRKRNMHSVILEKQDSAKSVTTVDNGHQLKAVAGAASTINFMSQHSGSDSSVSNPVTYSIGDRVRVIKQGGQYGKCCIVTN